MALLPALTLIGGLVQAVGAIAQGNAAAASAEYNARIQERNQIIENQNRQVNLRIAEIEADDKRRENKRTMGAIRAAYGSSGVDMAGSALDVIEDTALEMELDVERIGYAGRVANRESGIRSQNYEHQARLDRMEGKAAKTGGYLNAFGYFAGSAGRALSQASGAIS